MTLTISPDLDTLRAEYQRCAANLTALGDEHAALPHQQAAAAEAGDAERYAALHQRVTELPVPLAFAQLHYAQAGLSLARAELADVERHYAENPLKPVSAIETGGLASVTPLDYSQARAKVATFLNRLEHAQRECARLGAAL